MVPSSTAPVGPRKITNVVIEGLVVMKVIKHCQESFPMTVMGQLLGMDTDSTLEITNCYPFMTQPSSTVAGGGPSGNNTDGADSENFDKQQQQYQRDMMWCAREVNIDHQVVGWYQSTGSQMGSFISSQWIETQFNYQNLFSDIVCLVYDPVRTEEGTLSIKAYRLTNNFMVFMRRNDFTSLGFHRGVSAKDIIEEVPVSLSNSALINAALVDLEYGEAVSNENDVELSRLSLSDKPVLEQSLEFLICDLDTLGKEQSKYSYFMRNLVRSHGHVLDRLRKRKSDIKGKGPNGEIIPDEEEFLQLFDKEPTRLDTKILLKGLESHVQSIRTLAGEGIVKQFGVSAVQAGEE